MTALETHCFKGFVNLQYFKLVLAENFVGLILTCIRTIFQILKEQNKYFFMLIILICGHESWEHWEPLSLRKTWWEGTIHDTDSENKIYF